MGIKVKVVSRTNFFLKAFNDHIENHTKTFQCNSVFSQKYLLQSINLACALNSILKKSHFTLSRKLKQVDLLKNA